jgi:hypothetical protein
MRKNQLRHKGATRPATPKKVSLVALAEAEWGPLSPAETELLGFVTVKRDGAVAPTGQVSITSILDSGTARVIRGDFIRWLCVSKEAAPYIDNKGLVIHRAAIDGDLDLEWVHCGFPIRLDDCVIDGDMRLQHANFPYIRVRNSSLNRLLGMRLRLGGSLVLDGLMASGKVQLQGASIDGNVQLNKAHITVTNGLALGLERATVGGSVLMRELKANATILMSGASVVGSVHLNGAQIEAAEDLALGLESANIGGSVVMRDGFRCTGSVRLYSTQLGKNIECNGTIFYTKRDWAVNIEASKVGGAILLRDGFRCVGGIRIHQSTIEADVDLQSSRLTSSKGPALSVYGSRVKGSVVLRTESGNLRSRCVGGMRVTRSQIDGNLDLPNAWMLSRRRPACDLLDLKIDGRLLMNGARVAGELVLTRANVKNDASFRGAHLHNPGKFALRGKGFYCGGSLVMSDNFRADGIVGLFGAHVGDEFNAHRSTFDNPGELALDLSEASIHRLASFTGCTTNGHVLLAGASIASNLDMSLARFSGDVILQRMRVGGHLDMQGTAIAGAGTLRAANLQCKGSMFLHEGFETEGGAEFYGAVIEHDIYSSDAAYGNGKSPALILSRTRVGGHVILSGSTFRGQVILELAIVGGRLSFSRCHIDAKQTDPFRTSAIDASGCLIGEDLALDDGFTSLGSVSLARIRVGGVVSLTGATVVGRRVAVSLRGAVIGGDVDVGAETSRMAGSNGACLIGELDLSKATVDGSVDLTSLWIRRRRGIALRCERTRVRGFLDLREDFKTGGGIDLSDATLGSYLDAENSWSSSSMLRLQGLTYGIILPTDSGERLRWLEHGNQTTAPIKRRKGITLAAASLQPYEQLIQALKKQGHEREARNIAVSKQNFNRKHVVKGRLGRWANWLYGMTIQYGYRPQRALMFAPIFLVTLCFVFYTGATQLMVPIKPQAPSSTPLPAGSLSYPSFNPVAYAIETFVPILNLQQKESWRPDDRATCTTGPESCGRLLRIYIWIHMAAGWIITTFAVAGFTGLVRRD